MKGFVIAGTASGVGKTVASLTVMHALETHGYQVQPAKAGPDFIDPSHHETVTQNPSRTLDAWLQGQTGLRRNYYDGTGDICVVEGMMGLYDGSRSSTAMIADALDLPIVLVIDASAGMQSVAATALGFQRYADHTPLDIDVIGIIAQRAHGGRHETGIKNALPDTIKYFGRIPPQDDLVIPDRHLGLHMGAEAPIPSSVLDNVTEFIETSRLVDIARTPPEPPTVIRHESTSARIAVAHDDAFCFLYPATIERFRDRGTVTTFSPLAGDPLPPCDAVYLPGGYPEFHAADLATSPTSNELAASAQDGLPMLGECGGLMVLGETLTTTDGTTHDMTGILPADITMHDTYQALDHVELTATTATLTAANGAVRRGHEFHYSSATPHTDADYAFSIEYGRGIDGEHDGLTEYTTLGTYTHIHPESGGFDTFIDAIAPHDST